MTDSKEIAGKKRIGISMIYYVRSDAFSKKSAFHSAGSGNVYHIIVMVAMLELVMGRWRVFMKKFQGTKTYRLRIIGENM